MLFFIYNTYYTEAKGTGQLLEWTRSRKTQSRMDTIQNGYHFEWTPSRMNTIPNGQQPESTKSRMDTIE